MHSVFNTFFQDIQNCLVSIIGAILGTCVCSYNSCRLTPPDPEGHCQVHAVYSRCTWALPLSSSKRERALWHVSVIRNELRDSVCSLQLNKFQAADGLATFSFCHISPVQ